MTAKKKGTIRGCGTDLSHGADRDAKPTVQPFCDLRRFNTNFSADFYTGKIKNCLLILGGLRIIL